MIKNEILQKKKEGSWERLEAVINWANMSVNYFAHYIGLPRGENLYQIRRGNNGISRDVARRISTRFPEVNEAWLLTGTGDMFINPDERRAHTPFFDVDLERCIDTDSKRHPDDQINFSVIGPCDVAMRYTGLSMAPIIPTGAIVLLTEIQPKAITPNAEYLLQIDSKNILRTVLPTDSPEMWHIQAHTPLNGQLVEKNAITRAWVVKAWIKINK
uniref:hypothetical protein n=1 Tax=Alistipes sp. TaxID=1872444 RepID=UPI004056F9AC